MAKRTTGKTSLRLRNVKVEHWNPDVDGALSEAAFSKKLRSLGYSVSRYVYAPGTYFPPHTHEMDKIDAVVSGHFRITLEGSSVVLGPGDAVYVPHGAEHSAEVVGEDPVVSLDAVSIR